MWGRPERSGERDNENWNGEGGHGGAREEGGRGERGGGGSGTSAGRFFFQAEGGIRDIGVTGVQTCALPICSPAGLSRWRPLLLKLKADSNLPMEGSQSMGGRPLYRPGLCFQRSLANVRAVTALM